MNQSTYIGFLVLIFILTSFKLDGQTQDLYAYIVIQSDNDIGSSVDKVTMQNLMNSIQQNVPELNVHVKYIPDTQASKSRIQRELRSANIDDNDVVSTATSWKLHCSR